MAGLTKREKEFKKQINELLTQLGIEQNLLRQTQEDLRAARGQRDQLKIDKAMVNHEFEALKVTLQWWKNLVYNNLRVKIQPDAMMSQDVMKASN